MNPTSLITFPARLGYEVARRTLDLAVGAGRMVGLFGGSQSEAAAAPERPARPRRAKAKPGMDDATLTRKVESEIFSIRGVAKGKIDVNAADRVVWLRGEARTPQLIKRVEAAAAAVPEVKQVENLLHLPKTPAPTRTDTPARQRKTRATSDRAAARTAKAKATRAGAAARREGAPPERTTAERPTAPAEPAPDRLAATGEGRRPAPLGSAPVEGLDESVRAPDEAGQTPDEREVTRRFKAEEPGAGEPLPSEPADRGEGRQPAPLGAGDDAPGGRGGDGRGSIP